MKTIPLIFIFSIIIFSGCSATYKASKYYPKEHLYKDFNKVMQNKSLTIKLVNGNSVESQGALIINDSLKSNADKNKSYTLSQIKEISSKDRIKGLINGAIAGFLAGASVGGLIYALVTDRSAGTSPSFGESAVLGAASGFIIGIAAGYNIGFNINYEFN